MFRLFLCLLFITRRYLRRSTTNHKIRLLVKRKIGLNNVYVYFTVQDKTFCKTRLVRLLKFWVFLAERCCSLASCFVLHVHVIDYILHNVYL